MPSYLGPPLLVRGARSVFIERRVRIFPGMRAECHDDGRIFIHANVSIGQSFHITAKGDLHIGTGSVISGFVMITDIDHEYRDVALPVLEQPYIQSTTSVGQNCFIGMGARLQAGTVLGDGCVVGANAVVRGQFPARSVIVGAPGRVVKRYDPESKTWKMC
jgi:acetyltransferase-like isoleucine patch superfamily enzyme